MNLTGSLLEPVRKIFPERVAVPVDNDSTVHTFEPEIVDQSLHLGISTTVEFTCFVPPIISAVRLRSRPAFEIFRSV